MAFWWELLIREKTWSEDGSNLHHGASSRGQSLNLYLKSYNPSSHLPPNKPFPQQHKHPLNLHVYRRVRWLSCELHTTQNTQQGRRTAAWGESTGLSCFLPSCGRDVGVYFTTSSCEQRVGGLFHHSSCGTNVGDYSPQTVVILMYWCWGYFTTNYHHRFCAKTLSQYSCRYSLNSGKVSNAGKVAPSWCKGSLS